MDQHSLESLADDYGDALISLEQFAGLSGLSVSGLRSRSRRTDPDPEGSPFPGAVLDGSGRLDYRLDELVDWIRDRGISAAVRTTEVGRWALAEAAARCTAELGSDATQRVIAAAALAVASGWRPAPPGPEVPQLFGQVRTVFREAPSASGSHPAGGLPAGFDPDPDPITDPRVRRELFDGLRRSGRRSRPAAEDQLVAEVVRAWRVVDDETSSAARRDAFVEDVERQLLPQAGDPTARNRATAGSEAELMVALADVRPGHVVLDPALGSGNVLIAAVRVTAAPDGAQTIGVVGRELDLRTWLLAKIRFGLRGIAHQLGEPGADSLADDSLVGPFDRVVTDPDTGAASVSEWCTRIVDLLTPDGSAVARFGAADVVPPERGTSRRGWSDDLAGTVSAIVVTVAYSSSRSGVGMLLLRHDAPPPTLFVQIHPPPPGRDPDDADATEWVTTLAELVGANTRAPGTVTAGWHGNAYVSLMADLSLDALGAVDWDDLEVVRRCKEVRGRERPSGPGLAGLAGDPVAPDARRASEAMRRSGRPRSGPSWSDDDERQALLSDPVRLAAIDAVAFLRSLIDPKAPPPVDPPVAVSPKDGLRFAAEATDEMRRALERLEHRLRGKELRGRPRKNPDPPDQPET